MNWRTRYSASEPILTGGDPLGLRYVCCDGLPMSYNRFVDRMQRWWLGRFYRQLALAGQPALDVGCGTGRWSRRLAALGAKVTGTDLSAVVVADNAARPEHAGIAFVAASATALPFPDATFFLVQAVTVIQHIPPADQPKALAEMVRVCRPDGYVLLHEAVGIPEAGDAGVTWPHPPAEWKALVEGHGFACVREERSLFIPLYRLMLRLKDLARALFGWSTPGPAAHNGHAPVAPPARIRGLSRRLTNWFLVLALPLFYLLEWVCFAVLAGRRWTATSRFGGTQTFLFRRVPS